MGTSQNILCVADRSRGEKAALVNILGLAEASGAKVTVLDVLTQFPDSFHVPSTDIDLRALHEEARAERVAALHALARDSAAAAGTRVPGVLLREGIDYIEIIRQVQEGGHDLLAKACDNNTGLAGVLFGTLDMQLLRKCPCPLLIVKPRKKIRHARVLAALDLDDSDRKRSSLDRNVLQMAAWVAGLEEGTLDVLHAWHLPYEKKMRSEDQLRNTQTVDVLLKDLKSRRQARLDALASEWKPLAPRCHLIKGEPQIVIPRFVRNSGCDLVVMGSVGRSGVAGFFIGNTAEKILYGLNCSVLAMKPQGFKTPVR